MVVRVSNNQPRHFLSQTSHNTQLICWVQFKYPMFAEICGTLYYQTRTQMHERTVLKWRSIKYTRIAITHNSPVQSSHWLGMHWQQLPCKCLEKHLCKLECIVQYTSAPTGPTKEIRQFYDGLAAYVSLGVNTKDSGAPSMLLVTVTLCRNKLPSINYSVILLSSL